MSTSRVSLMAAAVALAFCLSARLAHADGESVSGCSGCNGYSFAATVTQVGTSSTYQVSYTITNNSGAASSPYNWSLTAFDHGDSVSASNTTPTVTLYNSDGSVAGTYSSDYVIEAGKSNNGNGNCNGTISYAFCVQQTGTTPLPVLQPGQYLTFTFDITCNNCGLANSWDFLSSGNNGNGNVYAISNWGTPTSMPEPSMVALYFSTLAVGLVIAWRSRASRRSSRE